MAINLMADLPQPVQLCEMDDAYLRTGVYFLWDDGAVVYVGQTKCVRTRIVQHITEGRKVFDAVSFLPCKPKDLLATERRYIERLLPKYNRCLVTKSIRRLWVGHMDKRPLPDCKVGAEAAAKILGVTRDELRDLQRHGLPHRTRRVPRSNARYMTYSLNDLHQFAAQRQDAFRAVREQAA